MNLLTIYQLGDYFSFLQKVACDHAGNDRAESALQKLSVCYVRIFIFPKQWKPEHLCIV